MFYKSKKYLILVLQKIKFMKRTFGTLLITSLFIIACSKNETTQNTEPADYAETEERLIQNPRKDSLKKDSTAVPSAMPPQAQPTVGNE